MAEAIPCAALHVTAAAGGGADRYIRELAAQASRRHFVLHVGAAVDVVEELATGRFQPLREPLGTGGSTDTAARWLRAAGIGIVHLHGVDEGCRARLAALRRSLPLPYVVTLHDLLFVNPRAFDLSGVPVADEDWIAGVRPVLLQARAVIAPSAFIGDLALRFAPGIRTALIAPGIRVERLAPVEPPMRDFAAQAPRHVVAVVGAIGPHKGSGLLDALAAALEGSDIGIVVIGYTDKALSRGWLVPGRLYVHGPYVDSALGAWLASYGTELVLFPNRLPESFSYTLSEVWASGLPVIVPDEGALGERVARHGGGWRLPAGFGGADAAAILRRLLSPEGAPERERVKSSIFPDDEERVPTLEAMSRAVDALYARFAQPPSEPPDADAAHDALTPLLAANLDGFVFRRELVHFAGALDDLQERFAESQRWNEKLERDIATLKREIERVAEENRQLADPKAAFDLLPEWARGYLLKRAFRARR
jgi:glycosyltransferase involved in cell wall biosynthesis